ncbi:SsgA family sporulation/cell division regulator [Streptomyces sp. NPDC059894]|uniref:SsgA family sporulation/cell division regulator n=1 Tax=unclassified Streptomyces TaxID=2593676 RepID=UPI00364DE356
MTTPPLPEQGLRPPSDIIALDVTVGLLVGDAELLPIPARFVYDPRLPFEVRLELPGPDGARAAPWVFARDLLTNGLRRPSGEGDVRVHPPCRCHGQQDTRVHLHGTSGTALLHIPEQPLRAWLVRTWEAVAPGEESGRIDWTTALDGLLPD